MKDRQGFVSNSESSSFSVGKAEARKAKKEQILKLLWENKSPSWVARELDADLNYVWGLRKRYVKSAKIKVETEYDLEQILEML